MDLSNILWTNVGPAPEDATGFGVAAGVSGRVWTIALSPNFDGSGTPALFLGTAGGGVWRSIDYASASPTWTPLTDHLPETIPLQRKRGLLNIGALAVDPNHPRTIYAGSGDPAGPGLYGNGLLKSTDGGNTWSLLSLVSGDNFVPGIARIFVDPRDESGNTLYTVGGFGVNSPFRGIYKSTDGGVSWQLAQGGMPSALAVLDLDYILSENNLTLLAGLADVSGNDTKVNGIWRSSDGGNSWSQMTIQLVDLASGQPLPSSSIGMINLAADRTPGTANGVYAAITNSTTSHLMNVYKLVNDTWLPASKGIDFAFSTYSAQSIGLSSTGAVYVGGANGWYQSLDGGANWASIYKGSNGLIPHVDHHAWAFDGTTVYNGNDGGIWRFTPLPGNQAGPGTWESLNTSSLSTILAQGVGIHPTNSTILLVGSQDNSIALRTSSSKMWTYVHGGDASRVRIDPAPQNGGLYAYTTDVSQYNFFYRSDDHGVTWNDKSVPGKPNVPFYARFAIHPDDTARLIVGLDRVYETRNRGDSWQAISPFLQGERTYIDSLTYESGDIIYVAYGDRLFKTNNDGGDGSATNWPDTGVGTDFGGSIIALEVDRRFHGAVYLLTDSGNIWRTANGGNTWENITGDLPQLPATSLALRPGDGAADPVLFVGTEIGVYASSQQGQNTSWSRLGSTLPDVSVQDLQYSLITNHLAAATYGRGVFVAFPNTDCGELLDQLTEQQGQRDADQADLNDPHLCDGLTKEECAKLRQRLEDEIDQLTGQIDALKSQLARMPICQLLSGVWQINANGFQGELAARSIDHSTGAFSGTLVFAGDARIDSVIGTWNDTAKQITFTRLLPNNTTQNYTGFLGDNHPERELILAGWFTESDIPTTAPRTSFAWFAEKFT